MRILFRLKASRRARRISGGGFQNAAPGVMPERLGIASENVLLLYPE